MAAYYNEFDPYAGLWLKNLIAANLIAPGDVDTRSIEDVHPDDLRSYTQCHFFAGVGVWSHALRSAGWPDDRPAWTGSCPCQPFSAAGKGAGFADERHLWPAFFHLIRAVRPVVVLGEQVASRHGLAWLDLVHADLEGAGYATGGVDTCAAGFGAPHIRQRLYWMARSREGGRGTGFDQVLRRQSDDARSGAIGSLADADCQRRVGEHALLRPEATGRDARSLLEIAGRGGIGLLADDTQLGCGQGSAIAGGRSEGTRAPEERRGSEQRGTSGGPLADTDGRHASTEGLQRGGEHGQQPQDGGADRPGELGHADDARSQGRRLQRADSDGGGTDQRLARTPSPTGSRRGRTRTQRAIPEPGCRPCSGHK